MKLSVSSALLAGILSASIYTTSAYASPWSCLEQWVNDEEAYLKTNHVSFWHQNAWLIEGYSFTANDPDNPFCDGPNHVCWISKYLPPYYTPLANFIFDAARYCGASAGMAGFGFNATIEGLAGHV